MENIACRSPEWKYYFRFLKPTGGRIVSTPITDIAADFEIVD